MKPNKTILALAIASIGIMTNYAQAGSFTFSGNSSGTPKDYALTVSVSGSQARDVVIWADIVGFGQLCLTEKNGWSPAIQISGTGGSIESGKKGCRSRSGVYPQSNSTSGGKSGGGCTSTPTSGGKSGNTSTATTNCGTATYKIFDHSDLSDPIFSGTRVFVGVGTGTSSQSVGVQGGEYQMVHTINQSNPGPGVPTLTGISLSSDILEYGQTATITPIPSNATISSCSSSNPSMLGITETTITSKYQVGRGVLNETVTCVDASTGKSVNNTVVLRPQETALAGIEFSESSIAIGETGTILPQPLEAKLGSCVSSNPKVLKVQDQVLYPGFYLTVIGLNMTGVAEGTATVTCGSFSGTVKVTDPNKTTTINLNTTRQKYEIGWMNLTPCSKVEYVDAEYCGYELNPWSGNFGKWICSVYCRECSPKTVFAPQEFHVYANMDVPSKFDLSADVKFALDQAIKDAIEKPIKSVVDGLVESTKACVLAGASSGVVAGFSTGGAAAIPAFLQIFNPCESGVITTFNAATAALPTVIGANLLNVPTAAGNNFLQNVKVKLQGAVASGLELSSETICRW